MNQQDKIHPQPTRVGVIGATGYSGGVLTQLLAGHPQAKVIALYSSSQAGQPITKNCPELFGCAEALPERFETLDSLDFSALDCLFTATPNGVAAGLAANSLEADCRLIDLSADFRLPDPQTYQEWYAPLPAPDLSLLQKAVYGLPEFNRSQIRGAQLLANPGCYPTGASLALLPLLQAGLVQPQPIIIDAKSGSTGAGKKASERLLFAEVSESFSAYNLLRHRHTPEIEQNLQRFAGTQTVVRFTPQLLPIRRGILCTIYLVPQNPSTINEAVLQDCLRKHYQGEPFVRVTDQAPSLAEVSHSNRCHLFASYDPRSKLVVVVSAIDNLVKGAAGQALQNFNLMFGLPETMGLQ